VALKKGTLLTASNGLPITVGGRLGEGGQGVVYGATVEGESMALKWYHQPQTEAERAYAVEQKKNLSDLVNRGSPHPSFLWPEAIVEDRKRSTFGYLMRVRDSRFYSFEHLVNGHVAPSWSVLAKVGRNLCLSFHNLHMTGLCYKDINLGGPFFDSNTGEILVCDNDNVRPDKTPGTIFMPHFAAPELYRGEVSCSISTDHHSLAVMLFYLFVRHHPLEGRRLLMKNMFGDKAQRKVYAEEPLFVFDPDDDSNSLDPLSHASPLKAWGLYPKFFQDAFVETFTKGLTDPGLRFRPRKWAEMLSDLHDVLLHCECEAENFYDRPRAKAGNLSCWHCKQPLKRPVRIRLADGVVFLNPGTELYPHHFGKRLDFSAPVARVTQHPKDPTKWGLENLGDTPWNSTTKTGDPKDIAPGGTARLLPDREINFGTLTGSIRFGG
jgi:eukaryotic-like serine/threonine-protein kinase